MFCVAEQAGGGGGGGGATGLLNKGGVGATGLLPGLVTKQQAVEFPQVQTSIYYYMYVCLHSPRSLSLTAL